MAIPQLRAEGVDQTGGSTAFTINFSGFTFQANDILEIVFATDGWVPVITTANGWALAQDPAGNSASSTTNGGVAGTAECGIFVYWHRAVGATATTDPPPVFQAPSVSSGTAWCLQPNSFSGARTTGTPYHAITNSIVTTATTAVTSVGATSTLADCLFMPRVASSVDDSTFNSWTMTGSSGPSGTKLPDTGWHSGAVGNQCAFTGDEGGFATAGGPHTGTTTFGSSTKQALTTLVMASLAEPAGLTATSTATLRGTSPSTVGTVAIAATSTATLGQTAETTTAALASVATSSAQLGATGGSAAGSVITGAAASSTGSLSATTGTTTAIAIAGASTSATLGATSGSATGTVTGRVATSTVTLASSGGSGTATIPLTASSVATLAPTSGTATAQSQGLSLGAAGIRQKANGTGPASGTNTSFAVYPAWAPSTTYQLDQAVRVTNAGNIYELFLTSPTATGTSASSGGPTTTGAAIVDGTAKWNYLGPGTGACNTQTSGSLMLYSTARGIWSPPATAPRDNKGNTLTTLNGPHFYIGFPGSAQILSVCTAAAGGTGHTTSADFAGSDEITSILVEVKGGVLVKSQSYVENNSVSNVVTSASVTTTGPAILVAFWWMNGVVRPSGQKHLCIPGSGFTEIPEATALMELSPGGAGQVQVATHYKSVASPGTYTASITTDQSEGSAVYLVAVQAADGVVATSTATLERTGGSTIGNVTNSRVGDAAITLAGDAVAGTGAVTLTGTGGVALEDDAVAGTGSTTNTAAGAITAADDVVAGTGSVTLTAAGALTTADDTATGTGSLTLTGAAAITLGDDTVLGGAAQTLGDAAFTLGDDLVTGTATVTLTGAGAIVLEDDSAAGTQSLATILASGAVTFADDTVSATASVMLTGNASIVLEDDDIISSPLHRHAFSNVTIVRTRTVRVIVRH